MATLGGHQMAKPRTVLTSSPFPADCRSRVKKFQVNNILGRRWQMSLLRDHWPVELTVQTGAAMAAATTGPSSPLAGTSMLSRLLWKTLVLATLFYKICSMLGLLCVCIFLLFQTLLSLKHTGTKFATPCMPLLLHISACDRSKDP